MAITANDLARLIDGTVKGDGTVKVNSASSVEQASAGQLAFAESEATLHDKGSLNASILIVPRDFETNTGCTTIEVDDPKYAFSVAASLLHPRKNRLAGIHPSAVIADTASIRPGVFVGAFCSVGENSSIGDSSHIRSGVKIGDNVSIGEECTIHQNVVIEDGCVIGSRVEIKAGAVIGSSGFGFARGPEEYVRFPQIGTLVIGDDCEIGANCCIDRGSLGETRIGAGTKIDNLVQIAHNVSIGERTVIASQTGIAGSAVIGSDCLLGGKAGIGDHTVIESGNVIGGGSTVYTGKRLRKGFWAGTPVRPKDEYLRLNGYLGSLPRLKEMVGKIARRLEDLERRLGAGSED